ncbi:MAG: hypothetical protein ABR601_11075, partial [Parasphingopyxis sp.]|nr:hypothetical protein [Sphingomonadales bacterium]
MSWGLVYNIVLVLCCGWALIGGGRPERIGAAMMFGGSMLSWAALAYFGSFFRSVEFGIMAIDIAMLIGLGAIAIVSDRYWPLWATGFHLIGLLTHGAILTGIEIAPLAYAHTLVLWSYLTLLSLALGTLAYVRRRPPSASAISPRSSPPSAPAKPDGSPPS